LGHNLNVPLADNLVRLVTETEQRTVAAALEGSVPPSCIELARNLPLTHARTSAQFVRIATDEKGLGHKIFSPAKVAEHIGKPVRAESAEAMLGTLKFVFLYCGQFRYPKTQVGFLFATTLENDCRDTSEASPFDSGALHKHVTWPDPTEPAQSFLARHSLPVPGHRELLAPRLRYLFADPEDYVTQSNPPIRPDPIGLQPKIPALLPDPRLWTFEVRVRDEVSLVRPHLLAVFYVARLQLEPSVVSFLSSQGGEVHVEQIFSDDDDAFAGLQSRCLDYLRRRAIIP